jgi:hypothetical protein
MKDSLHFDKTDEKLKESKEKLLAQFKKVSLSSPPHISLSDARAPLCCVL